MGSPRYKPASENDYLGQYYATRPNKLTEASSNPIIDDYRKKLYDEKYSNASIINRKPGLGFLNDEINISSGVSKLSDILGRSPIRMAGGMPLPSPRLSPDKPGQSQGGWWDIIGGNNLANVLSGRGDKGDIATLLLSLTGSTGKAATKLLTKGATMYGGYKYATDEKTRKKTKKVLNKTVPVGKDLGQYYGPKIPSGLKRALELLTTENKSLPQWP